MCLKKTLPGSQLSQFPSCLVLGGWQDGSLHDLAEVAPGEHSKARLHPRAFPWTTRWQFPISKGGSGHLLPAEPGRAEAHLPLLPRLLGSSHGVPPAGQTAFHARYQRGFPQANPSHSPPGQQRSRSSPPRLAHPEFDEEESILRPLPEELLQAALLLGKFVVNLTNVHRLEQGVAVRMVGVSNVYEEVFVVLQREKQGKSALWEKSRGVVTGRGLGFDGLNDSQSWDFLQYGFHEQLH